MSQHDYDIANADGATVRADLNSVLEAVASLNSGSTAPSTTFPYMWWADTANGILKRRNSANNGWISVMSLTTGLIIGTDVQEYDAALASLAGLSLVSGDILYATAADTLARLAKGTDDQVLTLASGLPTWADASGGITAGTPLVQNPFAVNTSVTQAHGLGAAPSHVVLEFECLTGEHNWTAGNKFFSSMNFEGGGTGSGKIMVDFDATNITAIIANAGLVIVNKTTFALNALTPGNWKMTITPYLVA